MKNYILYIFCLFFYSCTLNFDIETGEKNKVLKDQSTKLPNDIRWVVKSSEYKVLCEQIYKNAWDNLSSTLKTANAQSVIIMDLDETVLDNSKYQIGLVKKNESYNPESWSKWVNIKEAELVPGAKQFIDSVRTTKVRIIFLSNRMAKNEHPTMENMKSLNIYQDTDIFLLRKNKEDKKYVRRSEVINGSGRLKNIGAMQVLGYFGDAYHDFPEENQNYIFGQNMFMFPNPMYGKW